MATGVKPRDEETKITRSDLEAIQDCMKKKQFRDLLVEYCEEVRDPANQKKYQEEMTQLEKERGFNVTFINPKEGYVIKTSVAGDRKAFINICSNENVGKPSCNVEEVDGRKGMNWTIPYSLIPPREDYCKKRERCVIYDVVFHSDTLRMAELNKQFRELVNNTALEGLQKTYGIHFDSNNCRFPKSSYKGMVTPAVIRTEDPNYKPPESEEVDDLAPEILEKMYPQHTYQDKAEYSMKAHLKPQMKRKTNLTTQSEFKHESTKGYTVPKYIIKQQKNLDFQEFTYSKDCKQYSAIPSHIVIEINLPLLSSTKDCVLDVQEKSLNLISETPAKYKLDIALPYPVNDECGSAKFDKSKHKLIVTLPVIRRNISCCKDNSIKVDSGVESEENSGSQSDEENPKKKQIVEMSSTSTKSDQQIQIHNSKSCADTFLDPSLGYTLPSYTHNILDDIIAFTFHVKNTEPDSVKVQNNGNEVLMKFTSIGSGFVPVHYAAVIVFDSNIKFDNISGEAWDNNVILQLELAGEIPQKFQIGANKDTLTSEYFDETQIKKTSKIELKELPPLQEESATPVVEVTNLGTETNIVVSSTNSEYDEDEIGSPIAKDDLVWIDTGVNETGAKSILRKPMAIMRSFSESSAGDIASSMDYISSDCIPEESSLKKTVRFNDVIARQFYRYNSSIEGQKKKNQRKKSKKRNQERAKSESEAEDDVNNSVNTLKPRLKSVLKQRRDSGLADTSDAEVDCRTPVEYDSVFDLQEHDNMPLGNITNETTKKSFNSVLNIVDKDRNGKVNSEPVIWESEPNDPPKPASQKTKTETPDKVTCDNIKHNTDLYNPEKLNKGQYLEVKFKNDLIFDLDM